MSSRTQCTTVAVHCVQKIISSGLLKLNIVVNGQEAFSVIIYFRMHIILCYVGINIIILHIPINHIDKPQEWYIMKEVLFESQANGTKQKESQYSTMNEQCESR